MNKKLIIAIVGGIVLLIGIGLTVYFVSSSDNDATDSSASQPIVINEAELVECEDSADRIKTYCDADGKLIKQEHYDDDGNLGGYWLYEYDAEGNVIKREDYDGGNLEEYRLSEYDSDGNVIKREIYDADGNLEEYDLYEYDAEGNKIKTERYYGDGTLFDSVRFDADGNVIFD